MLRPATPLTVLLFAAFVLLVLSVISTPIVKGIPLSSVGGVNFGVLGFCQGSTCKIEFGYDTSSLLTSAQEATFDLSTGTRTTLSQILIVHPIAAFFTLIMLILAIAAHFHSPSHSPRFLLAIFILNIFTLILSILAFLIDVLIFVPHMAWGSYIVLAATVLITASFIVSCAMRRTLVSRKARKRRIDENAEMNGDNFRARLENDPAVPPIASSMSGGAGFDNKLPAFAQFVDVKKDGVSEERIPLTTRTPSLTSPNNPPAGPYGGQYGNPMPPPGAYGTRSRDPSADPSINRQYSDTSMNSRGRGGMPYRGRGGYGPPNGRGGYGPPPGSRGGYRGGYGNPNGGRGGYGPPGPPGSRGMNDGMMTGAAGGIAAGTMMRGRGGGPPPGYGRGGYNRGQSPGYGRRQSADGGDGYARNVPPRPPPPTGGYAAYNPNSSMSSLPRAESPPPLPGVDDHGPVGQAIEMDATTGSPSNAPKGFSQFGQLRDSDGDVAGMVGLQQQRQDVAARHMSETSRYSTDEYVPPRQAWAEGRSSPLNPTAQRAELPSTTGNRRASADTYYEDVDPRFADQSAPTNPMMPAALNVNTGAGHLQPIGGLDGNGSYEDLQSGNRSPAESERSNFTSVSQRGVNPRWNAQNGYGAPSSMPRRPPPQKQQREDMVLNSNPDFQIPGGRGRAPPGRGRVSPPGRAPGSGMVPGSAYPGI